MNQKAKLAILYFCCVFVHIVQYIYAKKKLRGLLVEGSAFTVILIASNILAFSIPTVDFNDLDPNVPLTVDLEEFKLKMYLCISAIIIAGLGTLADSFYTLFMHEKRKSKIEH